MANTRTVDFLPPIFQTKTNQQFLSATLDQLVQEPTFKQAQGFVGRKVGPGVNPNDKYVVELDATRANYQLEPGVISLVPDTDRISDAITYPGITDALAIQGANVSKADRLYTSDYYTWDPFINFDKFVNYSQYYWLPGGPIPVDVSATVVPLTDSFDVTIDGDDYLFNGVPGKDPVINLVRGGNYTFNISSVNNSFWIQSTPGVNGTLPWAPNISSRDVFGVINNGENVGTVTFNVPLKTAQEFYYTLDEIQPVDLISSINFDQINNIYLSTFLENYGGIDGISSLDNRTVIFTTPDDLDMGGWYKTTQFDPLVRTTPNQVSETQSYDVDNQNYDIYPYETLSVTIVSGSPDPQDGLPGSFDSLPYDLVTPIATQAERYSVWLIQYQYDNDGLPILTLTQQRSVNNLEKFNILFGNQWSGTQWYKDAEGSFQKIPLLTAIQDVLWYQDGTNPEIFGRISLIEQVQVSVLEIDKDIVGKKNYVSPNGVTFTNNMIVQFRGNVVPTSYENNTYYVAGVGTAIKLLPTVNYITPQTYTQSATLPYDSTGYDVGNFDANLNQPEVPDYITIALDSPDLNAWTCSNRWFHIDVINASAAYNNTVPVLDNRFRAKRPVLEYRGGTRLFKMGTEAKQPVNIIDFKSSDALSNINGSLGYAVDGYPFISGTRVIFAADVDPQVRNKIYQVEFISPSSDGSSILEPCINLVPAADADVLIDQCVVCLSGNTLQGKNFYYDGVEWIEAQQKTSVNQPPLFDVFDSKGISFGNKVAYPSSTFVGNKLFSYAVGTGVEDTVLGLPLAYLSLNNVGDIVFDNNLYTETFIHVDNNVSTELAVSTGFVRQYVDRTAFVREIGWQPAVTQSQDYQQFQFEFQFDTPLVLDIPVTQSTTIPTVKVFVGTVFQAPSTYTVTIDGNCTYIGLSNTVGVPGDVIEVLVLSDQASTTGFYQVPINLENNPFNANSESFTLGTIRTHYETIAENLLTFNGKINGANNTRDLGNIIPYGLNILQQSSPMTLAGYFLRKQEYPIFQSLTYNSREYEKFKAQFLNTAISNDYEGLSIAEIVTSVIGEITLGRIETNPFYWSDMLPASTVYTQTATTIGPIGINVFDTIQVYNFTSANYLGLLVYLNDVLLTRGYDYTVAIDAPRLTVTVPLQVGDVVTIQEFTSTAGNFVPNTPTKMGLYPAYKPEIYLDTTYVDPIFMIRGHDGSLTVAFSDFRDQLLLEFETRIYNNLKLDGNPVPLVEADVVPGQFRTTDYSLAETNQMLSQDFLSWVGWNKLDYKAQDYIVSNAFTYNYSTASNKLDNTQPLPVGAWRGIYNYFYDTQYPDSRPWEMLGFSKMPAWWEDEYGPAPYTSGNLVLWDDLAAGLVRDPIAPYILTKYRRPELTQVLPVGSEGALLSPLESVVGNYDSLDFRKSWVAGDDAPVENAWKTSSAYPFAVMRLLALTRPAEFFSLFVDRDLYKFDVELDQYLYNGRYRLDANGVQVYGDGVSKASYINWIVDFNRQTGINSTNALTADLSNLDVRLCYRLAAFTGKNLLDLYTEKSSPNSLNSSLLLPDESYNLLFYKNVPFDTLVYSSVIVQRTINGYAVYGYGTTSPYFNILISRSNGLTAAISAGGTTVSVPIEYTNNVAQVPYGYVFSNEVVVADFLLSYGKLLEKQGMIFTTQENGYILDWNQMVSEFLYWSNQGWGPGNVINLNPNANNLKIDRPYSIVDSIQLQTADNMVLDQNRTQLDTKNLVIDRIDNSFSITSLTDQTISYLNIKFVSFENMVVLDNRSIFADLIYNPTTGARQNRIKLVGTLTDNWNGQLDAPGFILNQDNIKEWQPNRKYARGEIVKYKNYYYSAIDIVQPATMFNFSEWTKSDYTKIQQGLLPNLPNKSNQLANSYDIYKANLETDQDLFSFGLIGFRPRQYMAALNLDDISQVNLYRQFLGTKGTLAATDIFKFADLGRGPAEYNIYENWAVQRSVYGANANRSYYELQLNEALLQSNPSLIQVTIPAGESSLDVDLADQEVYLQDVWNESYKLTSPDILTTIYNVPKENALPDAGYVDVDDADITVFDIADPSALNANLDIIGYGTTVWVAKVNDYDWNIYRTTNIPGNLVLVSNNLDGTSLLIFNKQHGLSAGDVIVIKYFSTDINGVYTVKSVPALDTLIINFSFIVPSQLSATGVGIVFKLQTQRVKQASDIINLPYSRSLLPGAKVWVDNNGSDHWQVLEKQDTLIPGQGFVARNPFSNSGFGSSIAQSYDNLFALVGAPNIVATGGVYTYVKTDTNPFDENSLITINAIDTLLYGHSVAVGYQDWMVAGAPASGNSRGYATVIYRPPGLPSFNVTTLLTAPDISDLQYFAEFGYSVDMSQDERWLYIGAPGVNAVYAYGRVDVEPQAVEYITDGFTNSFNYSNYIVIDQLPILDPVNNQQLVVVLNNQLLTHIVDYYLTATDVILSNIPLSGQKLEISRRTLLSLVGDGSSSLYSLNEYFYSLSNNIYSFKITVNGVLQRPNFDYEYDDDFSSGAQDRDVIFNIAPPVDATIEFFTTTYFTKVAKITAPASTTESARFGHSVTCSTDGRQVTIGAPGNAVNTGKVFVYDRAVQTFIVTNSSQFSYTVDGGTLFNPTSVILNNVFLVNTEGNLNGTFSVSGGTVTLDTDLMVGDVLEIGINQFSLIQSFVADVPGLGYRYGAALDSCTNNCSLYVGSPDTTIMQDSITLLQSAGIVERLVNQSRVYGGTTSLYAYPVLVAGDTLRINDVIIAVPNSPNNTVLGLVEAINSSIIPNVTAYYWPAGSANAGRMTLTVTNIDASIQFKRLSVLPGLVGTAFDDLGFDTFVYTQTIQSPIPLSFAKFGSAVNIDSHADNLTVGSPGATVYKANTFDAGYTYFDGHATKFNGPVIQSGAVYTFDYLPSSTDSINNPGKFAFGQQVYDNQVRALDQYGTSVSYINNVLLVGSPGSEPMVRAGRFVTGTQYTIYYIGSTDFTLIGASFNIVGTTFTATGPGQGTGKASVTAYVNSGRISVFNNPTNSQAWTILREQKPVVDVSLINSIFMYDRITSARTEFFDYIDPLQGKILGVAQQNINYIGAVDMAFYNAGTVNNIGKNWGQEHLGQIWWDTNTVRFINPNQDDITYASRRWSQVFPGSTVDVYQWVASSVPPANYTEEGSPKSISSYCISSNVNDQGYIETMYYFWVKGISSVASTLGKTLSATGIAQYIEYPRSSGIPYVAFINASTTALYNAVDLISAQDTILSIEFDRQYTNDNVHTQYDLIPQDRADGFLSDNLYRKLQDSFCGTNLVGGKVPDITLSPANRYGVQFRPRQSMFANRFTALQNYLTHANNILAQFPIVESRSFSLLNSREPEPKSVSGEWDKRVSDLEELSYQNFREVPVGYRYLVNSDSRQNGLWTIYKTTAKQTFESLALIRIQNYDTRRYWQYINWYQVGYNSSSQIVAKVSTYSALSTLVGSNILFPGASVKVTSNSQGKWEIYQYIPNNITGTMEWIRVGLQDGTIEFKAELWNYELGRFGYDVEVFDAQYFDQEPVIETRKIIQAINEELFIGDLLIERNRALVLMFNYILSEFQAPEWLVKTSLIDVNHKIRQLVPYQIYRPDNQDFVVDYLKEVKPYHVQIREINLVYDGFDSYQGTMTDFDISAYYDTDLEIPQFVSPVLTPYTASTATGTGTSNSNSDIAADNPIWTQQPWSDWYSNYLLEIQSVIVVNGGTGYSIAPRVVVTGTCITPAVMVAQVNSAGKVIRIDVIDPGSGYSTTAIIDLIEGNGIGATAIAVMGNGLTRNIKTTIKYDRYEYTSNIVEWQANVTYTDGTQVRHLDRVWSADGTVNTETFDPFDWVAVSAESLSGVNRTQGYYAPTANQPGLDLPLLIDGLDYPGVQVSAPTFDQDTGYDVGNFDINPFDNISYGPEGKPTYDPAILDAIYESSFLDPYLGTRAIDVNVSGSEFINEYSSYAPEELVPGAEFDTLDFRVYTQPGIDWDENGHGFELKIVKWEFDSINATGCSFVGIIPNPVQIRVTNQTQGRDLALDIDYSVNWNSESVTLLTRIEAPPANNGDILVITAFGIGGGNQLYKDSFNGAKVGNSITIPVEYNQIDEMVIFVNQVLINDYSYVADNINTTVTFDTTYQLSDNINITALGITDGSSAYSWSTALTQYFISIGELNYVLDNSMQGTNPANLVVEKNGIRARPPEGAEYIADGSTAYNLPNRGGYSQSLIADNDVEVWINNTPQTLYVDFTIEPYSVYDDCREVIFSFIPPTGATILISVSTKADYILLSNDGVNTVSWRTTGGFYPSYGDVVSVTSWNDTAQQDIATLVFQGPITQGIVITEPYDSTNYDIGDYDQTIGAQVTVNDFQLGRIIDDPTRLWVTLNGRRKFYGADFTLSGEQLVLTGPTISAIDVLAVTEFTNSIVPQPMEFRIFQDMRQIQATYRMTQGTTTFLVQDLNDTDDVIYVDDASALAAPVLADNIWGILIVNGERIMYRERDIATNTVSSLRRGTAGTAIASHSVAAIVYNLNRDNLAPSEYQDHYVTDYTLANGSEVTFIANDINLVASTKSGFDIANTIQVYVGGTLQTNGYTVDSVAPATITFDTAPTEGYQVAIQVRQGLSWYHPGIGTASDGVPLQLTDTLAAQFFRGQ